MIKVTIKDGRAYLKTPYNPQFVSEVKGIGGAKWNSDERAWSIPERALDIVREIMLRIYGEADQAEEPERVTAQLTFNEAFLKYHGPVVIMGKTVASAFGRDSGARVGDDAAFTEGEPESGGSMKNWYTYIPSGCKVTLYNVPKAMTGAENIPEGVTCEIIEQQSDPASEREALLKEREKILARLAEINKILGE